MIASLFWKEYREHRSVWIAMALLAVTSLAIATTALLPQGLKGAEEDNLAAVVGGALILTAMYGLVCGAMMLAGERESQGMSFLDLLPLSRAELWWSKCLCGLVFVLLYSLVVIATGVVLGLVGPDGIPPPWAVVVPLVGVETFAMGLCASTWCRTVLTAVAFAALLPLPVLWLLSGTCLVASPGHMEGSLPIVLIVHGAATLGALGLSLGIFVDRDFEKRFVLKPRSSSYGTVAPKRAAAALRGAAVAGAAPGRRLAGVLCVLGFLLGLALPAAGAGVWPAATLLLGVACGTAVFMAEQADGAFKFWGDQRLPVGWLWLRRSGLWAGVGAAVGALMLLGALIHAAARGGLSADPATLFERLLGVPPGDVRSRERAAVPAALAGLRLRAGATLRTGVAQECRRRGGGGDDECRRGLPVGAVAAGRRAAPGAGARRAAGAARGVPAGPVGLGDGSTADAAGGGAPGRRGRPGLGLVGGRLRLPLRRGAARGRAVRPRGTSGPPVQSRGDPRGPEDP